jgi:hypothetical protein
MFSDNHCVGIGENPHDLDARSNVGCWLYAPCAAAWPTPFRRIVVASLAVYVSSQALLNWTMRQMTRRFLIVSLIFLSGHQ